MSSHKKSRWAPGAAALADAASAVAGIVFGGRTADIALAPFANAPNRAAVRAITLGCCRWYLRLAPAIELLLSRPDGVPSQIRALLVAAAHQIEYSRTPPETSANAAVDAARILGHTHTAALVNAVLRRFVADRSTLLATVDVQLSGRVAHPQWLVEALQEQWPAEVEQILEANNTHPPMSLRVDVSRTTIADYLIELEAAGIAAQPVQWMPTAVVLERPTAVSALAGFSEGRVSVQDAGAQLAATLLDAKPGMRVLDACAAPGGKTGHLLERTPDLGELIAVDIDSGRVERISDNLRRLKRTAKVVIADVRHTEAFRQSGPFDRILLDAPCSATGVIRRHPDIKLLRRASDIAGLAQTQAALLGACFSMLAPGGRLLYSTCSVLAVENENVVQAFLETEPGAVPLPVVESPRGAVSRGVGLQLLPGGAAGSDGFYYACLEKTTSSA